MPGLPMIARATAFFTSPRGRIVVLVLRWIVAAVFLAAAIPKVIDPAPFATDIDNYRVVPDAWIGPIAVALPLLETIVGLALLTGVHARGAAVVASGMLLAFALAMIQAISRGIDLDCGCFGRMVATQVSWMTVARNLVLIVASLATTLGPDLPLWPLLRPKAI